MANLIPRECSVIYDGTIRLQCSWGDGPPYATDDVAFDDSLFGQWKRAARRVDRMRRVIQEIEKAMKKVEDREIDSEQARERVHQVVRQGMPWRWMQSGPVNADIKAWVEVAVSGAALAGAAGAGNAIGRLMVGTAGTRGGAKAFQSELLWRSTGMRPGM